MACRRSATERGWFGSCMKTIVPDRRSATRCLTGHRLAQGECTQMVGGVDHARHRPVHRGPRAGRVDRRRQAIAGACRDRRGLRDGSTAPLIARVAPQPLSAPAVAMPATVNAAEMSFLPTDSMVPGPARSQSYPALAMATDAPTTLLRPLAEDLRERRERIKLGGGEEKIAAQHAAEKLTARERIELLIDAGTFVELGIHGRPHFSQRAMDGSEAPADGVVTGYGKIDGRLAAVAAYDFTVMAGSMGMTGELKVTRLRELALTKRIPMIWLLDSAGARIQEAVGSLFAGSGHLFREEVVASGVVPQIAALMGPCAAGTAYIPGLADFVPMVRGRGSMALAGPHLVRAAVGEDVTQEELGGSRVHCRKSGVGDLEVESDEACIEAIKDYLSYFPQHCEEPPPVVPTRRPDRPGRRGAARRPAGLEPQALRHVRGDPPDRRRRRLLRPQAAVGQDDHHLPGAVRRAPGRDRGQPAPPARRHPRQRLGRQGGAVHQPVQRLRPPARLPDGRARASWSGPRSSRPGSSATGPRCSTRPPTPPCPRSPWCCARPTAPATT